MVFSPANEPLTASLVDLIHTGAYVDDSALPPPTVVNLYHERTLVSNLRRLKYLFSAGGCLPPELCDSIY